MRDLAIIMPTRNRPDVVQKNLEKTRSHFPDAPIYVFDDASDDPAAVRAAVERIPNATLIRSEKNVGPAGARRALIMAADARWCLALDDDCHPRDDFDPSRWVAKEPAAGEPIVIGFCYFRSYDGDIAPSGADAPGAFPGFMGGASLLHRERLMEVGNYCAAYVFGAEDIGLARQVWASGYQVWLDPTNFIIHDHVAAGRNPRRESYFYVRNRILLGALTLPLWYGIPMGFGQAMKRWLSHPHKFSGLLGLFGGLVASVQYFHLRRPLALAKFREIEALAR